MRNFRNALLECDLHDMGYIGDPFMWSNRQLAPFKVERLDRACANLGWAHLFPDASVSHLLQTCSDHKSEQCEKVVADSWAQNGGNVLSPGLSHHLELCQQNLKRWSSQNELEEVAARDEMRWKQRSKELWLKEGDRNTSFFHRRASNSLDDIARGTECLCQAVDASIARDLMQPYTAEEVSRALFQMAPLKSPSPDGMNSTHLVLIPNTFVPGRLIFDNILLAFEINHFLNSISKRGPGWMALKLDISKAYNKIEWSFLEQVAERAGRLQGVSICLAAPSISHLLFTDDTLIFCRASTKSTCAVLDVLEVYRWVSGQEINFSKS
ncbi:UNVERIFIED_CONTAM: hypothetical protein Sangu_3053800 [Sesamum angustifolium]|uniref:Reverse transcriptase n=1 Tax=Sesamum angustifolium TaxID=2727405 RepID=A0AAW2KFT9_9LAMI